MGESGITVQQLPKKVSFARPRFILFGDSLTEWSFQPIGWGTFLANQYARKADVILRGYSGYNSRWALHLLDEVFPKDANPPPALVTVFFGANDSVSADGVLAKHHVPLEEYRENLRKIIQHLQHVSKSTCIVLIAPPPVDAVTHLIHWRVEVGKDVDDCGRSNESIALYAEACVGVGKEMHLPVINLWKIMHEGGCEWKHCLSDGLHFAEAGNLVVFDALMRVLAEQGRLGQPLVEEEMLLDFPSCMDVDPVNHAETFRTWMERHH